MDILFIGFLNGVSCLCYLRNLRPSDTVGFYITYIIHKIQCVIISCTVHVCLYNNSLLHAVSMY